MQTTGGGAGDVFKQLANELGATRFVGYDGQGVRGSGQVMAIVAGNERVKQAVAGDEVAFVSNQTPFYAESGGQIGDTGEARTEAGARVRIRDTQKPAGDMYVHFGQVVEGVLHAGDQVLMEVDDERREQHPRQSLGHAPPAPGAQASTWARTWRRRARWSPLTGCASTSPTSAPMTDEQTRLVEDWVNTEIRRNNDSVIEVLPMSEAKARGAVAMFGEKYGDTVRVVRIGNESLEFCGGTHVHRAGDIGLFKIVNESGVAQGVRRIEAVTGAGALGYLRRVEDELEQAGARLKVAPLEVVDPGREAAGGAAPARARGVLAQGQAGRGRRA